MSRKKETRWKWATNYLKKKDEKHSLKNLFLLQILKSTRHNGFPVVGRNRTFVGLVLRKQLLIMLKHQLYGRAQRDAPPVLDYEHYLRLMNTREPTLSLEDYNLPSEAEQPDIYLDIKTCMPFRPTPF